MREMRCDRCGGAYWPAWGRVGLHDERICERCVKEESDAAGARTLETLGLDPDAAS